MFTKASIETYFLAEKNIQLICWLLGVLSLLLSAFFFFYFKTEKAKGAAIVLLLMGIFLTVVGLMAYQQNDALRLKLVYAFDMDPVSLKSKELPRAQRYLEFITTTHTVGFVLALLGLGTYFFARFKKLALLWQGVAIATVIMACMLAGMSYLSYDRTHHYLEALQTFTAAF